MFFTINNLSLLFSFFISLIAGYFVYSINKKNLANISFGLLSLSLAFWSFSIFFIDKPFIMTPLFWTKLSFLGPAFMPYILMIFIEYFPDRTKMFLPFWLKIILLIPPVLISLLTLFTNFFIDTVTLIYPNLLFNYGQYYSLFSVYMIFYFALAVINLIRKYFFLKGKYKTQLKIIILGTIIAVIFGISINLILPIFGNSRLYGVGPLSSIIFLSFIAYIMLRHSFLDIEIIIRRSFIFTVLIIIITATYVTLVVFAGNLFQQTSIKNYQLPIALLSGILISLGFQPLRELLINFTDKYFFQKSYNYQRALRELSKTLNISIDIDRIILLLMEVFIETIKVKSAMVVLIEKKTNKLMYRKCDHLNCTKLSFGDLTDKKELIDLLSISKRALSLENINEICKKYSSELTDSNIVNYKKVIEQNFKNLEAHLIVPIFFVDKLSGFFVLGQKLSQATFSKADLNLLETIAYQAGTAIVNALLYEEAKIRVNELSLLFNVGKIINHALISGRLLEAILYIMTDSIGVDRALVGLIHPNEEVHIAAIKAQKVDFKNIKSIIKKVDYGIYKLLFNSEKPIILAPDEYDLLELTAKEIQSLQLETEIMFIPLISRKKWLGYLAVDNKFSKRPLKKLNDNLLMAVAGQIATALENVKLYEEAIDAQQKIAEAERLAALGSMTAGFAHEIKNPIVSLKTFTSLLPEKFDDENFRKKYMKIVPKEVVRINKLVEEMLLLGRKKSIAMKPLYIKQSIQDVLNLLENDFKEAEVNVKFLIKDDTFQVYGDKDQLKQVFLNLFKNAIDAMPKGGDLTINVKKNSEDQVQVTIKDTGMGIDQERLNHVFEPFYTTRHYGTGLGLAITHKIIKDHNSNIKVESTVNQGTKFIITFPC